MKEEEKKEWRDSAERFSTCTKVFQRESTIVAIRTLNTDTVDSLALEKHSVVGRTVKKKMKKSQKRKKISGDKLKLWTSMLSAVGEKTLGEYCIKLRTEFSLLIVSC